MDKKFSGSFKKPRSSLGRRLQRLNDNNDSRLEPISEAFTPTTSTSTQKFRTPSVDESLLGYDSLCDETLRTPLSHKYPSADFLKTPTAYTSRMRFSSCFTDSHKKTQSLRKPETTQKRSVKIQTTKNIAGTPPHVLRQRLNTASSAFIDLEEEYNQLTEFTTLEKQILAVEGLSELKKENADLKSAINKHLEERIEQSSKVNELETEIVSLKGHIESVSDEATCLKKKLEDVTVENEKLKKHHDLAEKRLRDLEAVCDGKETSWKRREDELIHSLQEAWNKLDQFNKDVEELEAALQGKSFESEKLYLDLKQKEESFETMNKSQLEAKTKIEHLNSLIEEKSLEIDLINKNKIKIENTNELLTIQLRDKENEVSQLLSVCSHNEFKICSLKNELIRCSHYIENIGVIIESNERTAYENQKMKEDILSELTHLRQIELNQYSEIKRLESVITDLKNENICNLSELNSMKLDLSNLLNDSSLITSEDILTGVKEKLNDMEDLIEHLKNVIQSKNDKISEISNFKACQSDDNKVSKLELEITALKFENESFKEKETLKEQQVVDLEIKTKNLEHLLNNKAVELILMKNVLIKFASDVDGLKENLNLKIKQRDDQLVKVNNQLILLREKVNCYQKLEIDFANIQDKLQSNTLALIQSTQNETDYLNQCKILKERVNDLERDIELKSNLNIMADEKIKMLTSCLSCIKESLKDELKLALSTLDDFETKQEENFNAIENLLNRHNQLEDCFTSVSTLNKRAINEKDEFFANLKKTLCDFGLDYDVSSFNDVNNLIDSKFTELYDFNEHLKNVIQSKEDQLVLLKKQIVSILESKESSCLAPSDCVSLTDSDGCITPPRSSLESHDFEEQLKICYSKLTEVASLFYSDQPAVDNSNFEDVANLIKTKVLEMSDKIEHLRNLIQSKADKISYLSSNIAIAELSKKEFQSLVSDYEEKLITAHSEIKNFHLDLQNKEILINQLLQEQSILKEDQSTCKKIVEKLEQNLNENIETIKCKDDLIKELEIQLDLCKISTEHDEKEIFFDEFKKCVSNITNDEMSYGNISISSYKDIITYLREKLTYFNDLIEHLRNKNTSKDDKLEQLSNNINILKRQITELELNKKDVLELKEKLEMCRCDMDLQERTEFFNSVGTLVSSVSSNVPDLNSFGETLECLQVIFNEFNYKNKQLQDKETSINHPEELSESFNSKSLSGENLGENDRFNENTKMSQFYDKHGEMLDSVKHFLVSIGCNALSINTWDDVFEFIRTELTSLTDEKEKLKNAIKSKDYYEDCNCCLILKDKLNDQSLSEKKELIEKLKPCICRNLLNEQFKFLISFKDFFYSMGKDVAIDSFNDIMDAIQSEVLSLRDLNEHLRNKVSSKNEKIKEISNSCLALKDDIFAVQAMKEELLQKLEQQLNEKQSFFTFIVNFSSCDKEILVNSFEDVVSYLKDKFSSLNDLNEHLRNKITSKEDQLRDVSNECNNLQDELNVSRKIIEELRDKLDHCSKEVQLTKTEGKEKQCFIDLLQDKITLLDNELKNSLDNFLNYKEEAEFKITELENLKKHYIEELQSLTRERNNKQLFIEQLQEKMILLEKELKSNLDSFLSYKEETELKVTDLENSKQHYIEELQSLTSERSDKQLFIEQLQEKIILLEKELKSNMDSFLSYKEETELKIMDIKDLKEHTSNKLLSKNDKIQKITQELLVLREKCLQYEKSSSSHELLSERILNNEKYISQQEKNIEDKDLKIQHLMVKLNELEQRDLNAFETKLGEAYKELDMYKTNEVNKDNLIQKLKEQVCELTGSLNAKAKEVFNYNDNMDRLSQNIVELMRDKEIFFDQLKNIASFVNIKTFDDVLDNVKTVCLELLNLKESTKTSLTSFEELNNKLNEQNKMLSFLKEDNSRVVAELSSCKEKYSDEIKSLVNETDQLLFEVFPSCSLGLSDLCLKEKLIQVRHLIAELQVKIKNLESEFENQNIQNSTNMAFIEQANADILITIESTNNNINDLSAEMTDYKVHSDERFRLEHSEIEALQKEVYLSLADMNKLLDVSEQQNKDIISLSDAYLNLQTDYASSMDHFKTCLQSFCDSESSTFNEFERLLKDLIAFIYELLSCNVNSNKNLTLNEDFFSNFVKDSSQNFSELCLDLCNLIKNFKEKEMTFINENDEKDISPSITDLKIESSLLDPIRTAIEEMSSHYIPCNNLIKLIDSVTDENRIIDQIYLGKLEQMKLNQNHIKSSGFKSGINIPKLNTNYVVGKPGVADMSMFMSVVDQTYIENLDSSTTSNGRNDSNYNSPHPERTHYILPETLQESYVENTLVLHHGVNTTSSSLDPLKSNKTIASSASLNWLRFDNNLDESGAEFLDAQDSIDVDPLSSEIDINFKLKENLIEDYLLNLKELLGIQTSNTEEILIKVKDLVANSNLIKTSIKEMYPEVDNSNIYFIFRTLTNKILELEKINKEAENKCLNPTFLYIQKELEELKKIKDLVSVDIERSRNFVSNNISLIFKTLQNNHDMISIKDKYENLKNDLNNIVSDNNKLKELYDRCLIEMDSLNKINSDLKSSLQDRDISIKEISVKYEELLNEKNNLTIEFNKSQIENQSCVVAINNLKEMLEVKNNENVSFKDEIANLNSSIKSLKDIKNDNENKLKKLLIEKNNLLSEISSLKDEISPSDSIEKDINLKKEIAKCTHFEKSFNTLKDKYDELLKQLIEAQNKNKSLANGKSFWTIDYTVRELKVILKILDLDDDFNIDEEGLALVFSKIQRRINLLKEHHEVVRAASSETKTIDLNQKIRSLENEIKETSNFKLSFSKELQSLKPELAINDLLKRPFAELHKLLISEIMSREHVIISNLNTTYEQKISSLKEEINQLVEKDKRRDAWVFQVETDNENLNTMTEKLKEDILSVTEKLDNKLFCEKYIMTELNHLEQRLNNEFTDEKDKSTDIDLEVVKKSELSGTILTKLQKMAKNYLPYDPASQSVSKKYKEMVNDLEEKCRRLQKQVEELEISYTISNNEIENLKNELHKKIECHNKEIEISKQNMASLENSLTIQNEKLKIAEQRFMEEQKELQREKEFSLKIKEESNFTKQQLENNIKSLTRLNSELTDAKESIKMSVLKYEEEISSLMKVISNLESELKLSRDSEEVKGAFEHELTEANTKIFQMEADSILNKELIMKLETKNSELVNQIHQLESHLSETETSYQDNIASIMSERDNDFDTIKSLQQLSASNKELLSKLQNKNEDLVNKVLQLESLLTEKEVNYQDSISSVMRERESDLDKMKALEEFSTNSKQVMSELENRAVQLEEMCSSLQSNFNKKELDYHKQIQQLESFNEELNKKIEIIETNMIEKEKEHCTEVNLLKTKISKYLDKINQLDKCVSESKESYSSFNAELLKLFPECSSCSGELLNIIKTRLAEITALKEDLEDKTSECKYLEEDCDEMIQNVKDLKWKLGEAYKAQYDEDIKYNATLAEKEATIQDLQNQVSLLSKENSSLKVLTSQSAECKECKELMEQVIHFKAKLKVTETKLGEHSGDTSFNKDTTIANLKKKIFELEKENLKLIGQVVSQPSSVLKDIHNQQSAEQQTSKITKLESRIIKLEKDREFLKKICDKRFTVINNLTSELESLKKRKN